MGSPENIGKMLYCFCTLERKTYEMYNELSKKVDHETIKSFLITIAQDSLKHHNLFEEIGKDLNSEIPSEKQCKRNLGKTWNIIEEITRIVKELKSMTEKDLFTIIERLAYIEHNLGEEYTTLEKTKMIRYMNKEISENYGIDFRSKMDVLDSIINDEIQHINYLREIHETLKENNTKADNNPEFKYQNPDAWWVPSHSQKTGHVIG